MYHKKLIFATFLLIIPEVTNSQCAMCKAVIEGGNETIAEGVNNGITYLMIFPYILVGLLFFLLYKYRKKVKN